MHAEGTTRRGGGFAAPYGVAWVGPGFEADLEDRSGS